MKKHLIILILRILETHSDEKNPLTQVKIAEEISKQYPCDRKTVGRNIHFLKNLGYPIVKTPKGFYMDKQLFTRKEVAFVVNAVKNAESDGIDVADLCKRLEAGLSRYYKYD